MRLDEIYDTACEMNEIEKNKSILSGERIWFEKN